MTPLSMEIMTRGKSVVGKTAIGMLKSRYPPIRASVVIRKMTDLCSRANQYFSASDLRACATLKFLSFEFTIGRVTAQLFFPVARLVLRWSPLRRRSSRKHLELLLDRLPSGRSAPVLLPPGECRA